MRTSRNKKKTAENEEILIKTYFTQPTAKPYTADYGSCSKVRNCCDNRNLGYVRWKILPSLIRSHHFLSPAILIFVSSAVSVLILILNNQYHRCLHCPL